MSFLDNIIKVNKTPSIYERIHEHIEKDGLVPENFEPEPVDKTKLRFAPGAMEGIMTHHGGGSGSADFVDTFKRYLNMTDEKIMKKIDETPDFTASSVYSAVLDDIFGNREMYPADKILSLANTLTQKSKKTETVKFGLSLFALFRLDESCPESKIIEDLGLCENFTYYANLAADNCFDKQYYQKTLFNWAKKLHGWGKIDTVEYLEPSTDEIKHWLLCHGCKNGILNSYLALVCVQKADVFERLQKGSLTDEEYSGVTEIVFGLLDEGPCAGMSAVDRPIEFTLLYLGELEKRKDDIDNLKVLSNIKNYFKFEWEDEDNDPAPIFEKIEDIEQNTDVETLVLDNLAEKTMYCRDIAESFGIDISKPFMELVRSDTEKYYADAVFYFVKRPELFKEYIAICEEYADESKYPDKMGEELGIGKPKDGTLQLDFIVQSLDKYPLTGQKLIMLSLRSPVIRWRSMAAKALEGWVKKLNKPLCDIDAKIYAKVKELAETEVYGDLKTRWEKLINNT